MKKFSEFDPASYLNSEETRREYLNEVFASGDEGEIKRALFLALAKSLSASGNIISVLRFCLC